MVIASDCYSCSGKEKGSGGREEGPIRGTRGDGDHRASTTSPGTPCSLCR
jgi:hypothetical protein